MALMKCKECGNDVSTSASVCPKCGAPVVLAPNASKRIAKGVGLGCGVLLVAVVLIAIIGNAGKKTAESEAPSGGTPVAPTAAATPAAMVAPMNVLAKDLYADYHANEVSADDKYKGKLLAVGGVVGSIEKDAFDNVVVKLRAPGGDQFGLEDVMATLRDSEKPKAAALTKGQVAVVRCKGNGMVLTTPMLSDCVLFVNEKK